MVKAATRPQGEGVVAVVGPAALDRELHTSPPLGVLGPEGREEFDLELLGSHPVRAVPAGGERGGGG
ncbi:hypothetical protein FRZ03_22410 [Streptomyces misionensis]|uniref:Uncharacterized protein n=1 Tax=Streptomyces misionensis TaxID=67331 RepID=A0A5C6JG34_9ACTN|nr:hypothetical protein [Streptomyces misionensis]TWV40419.1 hypothetical protein FRZ03_22410 [Streptomyces misionensis]